MEDLNKKLENLRKQAEERNKHRQVEMFTTDKGYSAIYTVEESGEKTLTLDDNGYLSKFTITEEGPVFDSLEDYKGVIIHTDTERIALYSQEATTLFQTGKLAESAEGDGETE